jgi:hypothetical protein
MTDMKTNSFLIVLFLFCSSLIYAQNNPIIKLFEKYENENNVTVVSISKAMFNLIPNNIQTDKVNLKNLSSKIESLLLISSDKPEMRKKMSDDFKLFIDRNQNYEELMRVKDNKSLVTFHAIKKGERISELIMLVNEDKNFVAIRIAGNFLLEEIQQIIEDN